MTILEPPCTTSIDDEAGTLTPFIRYLALLLSPASVINTSSVSVVVKMFANRKPTTASSLSAVNMVVAEFVILAPFDSKSCATCPPYKAIAIATAKPAVAPLLAA